MIQEQKRGIAQLLSDQVVYCRTGGNFDLDGNVHVSVVLGYVDEHVNCVKDCLDGTMKWHLSLRRKWSAL